ncbi:MAG TPA: TerC family protein [Chthoniobacteraceae bacterium]|jgi:predicted tellurium resistance membrane protein TerC|nr:TerC family protein [Chthoniobacteraceae bacterium]
MDLHFLSDPQTWLSLITLTALEVVLGIDNIIVISILAGRLPNRQQPRARLTGLAFALVTRILLLCLIFWLTKLTFDLFKVLGQPFSGKDLVMVAGGLFLIWKSVHEIHGNMEGEEHHEHPGGKGVSFAGVIVQIVLFDIVFSLDSVITAVGMAQHIPIMIAAVVLAMIMMMFASGAIGGFVNRHPTIKMLALAFLLVIGVVLVADGFRQHVSKGYIYFAMAFSFMVELLNLRMRSRRRKAAAGPPHPPEG